MIQPQVQDVQLTAKVRASYWPIVPHLRHTRSALTSRPRSQRRLTACAMPPPTEHRHRHRQSDEQMLVRGVCNLLDQRWRLADSERPWCASPDTLFAGCKPLVRVAPQTNSKGSNIPLGMVVERLGW